MKPVRSKLDWGLVVLLTPIALLMTSLVFNGVIDPYDEGLHFLSYPLYEVGRLPYIDYYPLFPPLWVYSNIFIEKIFGEYLLVQRLWFVAQACLVVWASYALCKRVYSSVALALCVSFLVIIFAFHPFWLPRWSGARLAVYIWFLLIYIKYNEKPVSRPCAWLFLIGLIAGAANLYAFDVGIHITVTGVAMMGLGLKSLWCEGIRTSVKLIAPSILGFTLPLAGWALYLSHYRSLYDYIYTYYYTYMFKLMPISVEILSGGNINFRNPRFLLLCLYLLFLTAGLFFGLVYIGLSRKDFSDRWKVLTMAILLSLVIGVSTIRALNGPQFLMFSIAPAILWLGFVFDRITPNLLTLISRTKMAKLQNHMPKLLLTSFFILSALSLYSLTANNTKGKLNTIWGNVRIAANLLRTDRIPRMHNASIPTLAGVPDGGFADIVRYLRAHTKVGESILAFPMYVEILPALADRPSATKYPVPILLMGSPKLHNKYIREINNERPCYAVFYPAAKFGGKKRLKPFFRRVYRFLISHYHLADDFRQGNGQQIWVRNNTCNNSTQ